MVFGGFRKGGDKEGECHDKDVRKISFAENGKHVTQVWAVSAFTERQRC